jgi:hypothetical protein
MSISEETLLAYVDGELDAAGRAEVEAAMRDDPLIARRVAQHRDLKARIQLAYAADLTEPVPERLVAATRGQGAKVVDLGQARAARANSRAQSRQARWRPVASMAASLLIGVGLGFIAWRHPDSVMIESADGTPVAGGTLARELSSQLAGERSSSAVQIGLSFVAKSGDYCRTFVSEAASAGVACRHAGRWEIRALARSGAASERGSDYRTASSSLPPAIMTVVEGQIAGDPLDRAAEIAARRNDWRPVRR